MGQPHLQSSYDLWNLWSLFWTSDHTAGFRESMLEAPDLRDFWTADSCRVWANPTWNDRRMTWATPLKIGQVTNTPKCLMEPYFAIEKSWTTLKTYTLRESNLALENSPLKWVSQLGDSPSSRAQIMTWILRHVASFRKRVPWEISKRPWWAGHETTGDHRWRSVPPVTLMILGRFNRNMQHHQKKGDLNFSANLLSQAVNRTKMGLLWIVLFLCVCVGPKIVLTYLGCVRKWSIPPKKSYLS